MDYRSIADELISRIRDEDVDALDERWDPELHGDVSKRKSKKRRKAAKQRDKGKGREVANPSNHYLQRSNEFVVDSDDMDGDAEDQTTMGAYEPQGYNRYNALSMADNTNGVDEEKDIFHDGRNANGR